MILNKIKEIPELSESISALRLRTETIESLMHMVHEVKLDHIRTAAATKIRAAWLRYAMRSAYFMIRGATIRLQRYMRRFISIKRIRKLGNIKRTMSAVVVQRFMRGYIVAKTARHAVAQRMIHKTLDSMQEYMGTFRHHIKVSL